MPAGGREHDLCGHGEELAQLRRRVAEQERELIGLRRELAELRVEPTAGAAAPPAAAPEAARPAVRAVQPTLAATSTSAPVSQASPAEAKIGLYRELFAGRDDVYARRWENPAKGRTGWSPVHRGTRHTRPRDRQYLPLTDEVVRRHLEGRDTIGLYPLLRGDICRLLACDFDGSTWQLDAQAYVEAAHACGVPTALEISRSGNGAHVWTFFSAPVSATRARAMGAGLLREAMARRGELDLESYDRFFPSQDYLPDEGFGNLIALPLQGQCRRERRTTVFVDPHTFEPIDDQFAFLSSLHRMDPAQVDRVVDELRPVVVGPATRLYRSSVREDPPPPPSIEARLSGMLAIRRAGIPPGLYATLKHLATLHNPTFHRNENLRLSNWATPRYLRCYVEDLEHLHLPRGVTEQATTLVEEAGSRLEIVDERPEPAPIDVTFEGSLREGQQPAVEVLARYELGVLEAPPGTGKTVMACALIARHATPTLVLVDECHHVPAPTVERAVRGLDARRWLGLTATPRRGDGRKQIMVMHCGPIRHRITEQATALDRRLLTHHTEFAVDAATEDLSSREALAVITTALVEDDARNEQICRDVDRAVTSGRSCLVLSSRTRHVEALAHRLEELDLEPLVLHGRLRPAQRRAVLERLAGPGRLLLVATDRYVGEGFDVPRLDTLFLTFPVSSPERIVQYAGRIVRDHPGKDLAVVHDYLDDRVGMLVRMHGRRQRGYRQVGFAPARDGAPASTATTAGRGGGRGDETSAAQVRAWARSAGHPVADRGRIPAEVWLAYREAHG